MRVVIIGGGFAGLNAARGLARADVRITLIDRRNFHLFQPLLYQVATGSLSPGDISAPLRSVLSKQKNVTVLLAGAADFDLAARAVILDDGSRLEYDFLIVATGARHHYFGHPGWVSSAPGLKTIEDATEIRRKIFTAFESAEREPDPAKRQAWLRFVVVGGGPTGVELAGALGEIANDTLRGDFRRIRPEDAQILLFDAGPRILSAFPPELSLKAEQALIRKGVRTRVDVTVTSVGALGLSLKSAAGEEWLDSRTILWAAGVQGSSLGRKLAAQARVECDRAGRVPVDAFCTIAGHPEVFVLGDMVNFTGADGKPLPGVAPVAMQQGQYAARSIRNPISGGQRKPFVYLDKGSMATIGRARAVVSAGPVNIAGPIAWLLWLFIHLMYLVGFRNRLVVLIQWAYQYITFNRGARLITGEQAPATPPGAASPDAAPPGATPPSGAASG